MQRTTNKQNISKYRYPLALSFFTYHNEINFSKLHTQVPDISTECMVFLLNRHDRATEITQELEHRRLVSTIIKFGTKN